MEDSKTPNQPLAGMRMMVTRAESAGDPLADQLQSLGAEIIVQPAIRISPPADWRPVDEALAKLQQYDWLVFSSANGVRYLLERLGEKEARTTLAAAKHRLSWCEGHTGDVARSASPPPHIAAIGLGTAAALARYGWHTDLVPDQFRAEALAEALRPQAAGRRFLLVRASRGREILAEQLTAAGGIVEQVVVYLSSDVERPDDRATALLMAGRIDWITVTSSAIARSLARLFGDQLRSAKLASISPLTSATLRELGYSPEAEAAEYTLTGLVEAIVEKRRVQGSGFRVQD